MNTPSPIHHCQFKLYLSSTFLRSVIFTLFIFVLPIQIRLLSDFVENPQNFWAYHRSTYEQILWVKFLSVTDSLPYHCQSSTMKGIKPFWMGISRIWNCNLITRNGACHIDGIPDLSFSGQPKKSLEGAQEVPFQKQRMFLCFLCGQIYLMPAVTGPFADKWYFNVNSVTYYTHIR